MDDVKPLCAGLTREQSKALYADMLRSGKAEHLRPLAKEDLFALLTVVFHRRDVDCDWLYDRCREVEAEPDGMLDLWSREHYKSTIITYALTIQDILRDPEVTVGIFSHTRPIAKAFLAQIKREFETNDLLKQLFPDICYERPERDSPCWSLDNGILVKRRSNNKEKTVEAWGLVDGQPTSKHFSRLIYDDVVTRESVTNPDQIKKTTEAWELSLNLGAHGGKRRFIGTRYHGADTWSVLLERGAAKPRTIPATHDGTPTGRPVFLSEEVLAEKRRDMGPYTFAAQMLQDPLADAAQGFREEWLSYYDAHLLKSGGMNRYILVDPAGEKKKDNDYTVMVVIGLNEDGGYYELDGLRDRLNLTERAAALFRLVEKWGPIAVGYEKYGLQADIEHMKYEMELRNFRFRIVPLGGPMPKGDRIRRLVPVFEQGRYHMPRRLLFIDREGKARDMVDEFVREEYTVFPVAAHDDMLDAKARILDPDLGAQFPIRRARGPLPTTVRTSPGGN